jgi:hypothetical protein
MKNLILSAIFAVVAFSNNAQVVTITVFQTADAVGSNDRSLSEILNHPDQELPINLPNTFLYEIDFTRNVCILKNDENSEVARVGFVVKNKKSNRDFEIEFTDPNDEFDNTYGIVVSNNLAAYFENNGSITELILFKAFIIL